MNRSVSGRVFKVVIRIALYAFLFVGRVAAWLISLLPLPSRYKTL